MKEYFMQNIESFSQTVNTLQGGNANVTFSARLGQIRDGSEEYWILPKTYWHAVIWLFEKCWKGHLDWALTKD